MRKVVGKERVQGRIRKKFDEARPPIERILERGELEQEQRLQWEAFLRHINPAHLKRQLERLLPGGPGTVMAETAPQLWLRSNAIQTESVV